MDYVAINPVVAASLCVAPSIYAPINCTSLKRANCINDGEFVQLIAKSG
jgi:hypothetical protein